MDFAERADLDGQLREGGHIHSYAPGSGEERCRGGDSECYLFQLQLEEAMEAWSGT